MKYALALATLLIAPAAFAAETYTLDPYHTNITWHANHLGFSNPSGKFATVSGTLTLDEEKPEKSKVEVTVETGSVITGIAKFDEHLKGKDFFNSEAFPTAKFVSDDVSVLSENTAKVHGNLTMLGITKPIMLNVKLNKIGIFPMNNKKTAGFSATTTIKRSDFGMNYGLPGVSDEIPITIEAEATIAQ